MFRQNSIVALVASAGIAFCASADTVDLNYIGVAGGTSAAKARIGSSTYYAGHMNHTITSGSQAGQSFYTFCIEVGEFASNGSATYEIVDLADAPDPGLNYGQAKADAVSAIVANAHALGWIDAKLQANSGQADYLAKMGAIQAAIWEALGHDFQVNSSATSTGLRDQYEILMNVNTFDGNRRMHGLRAAVAVGQQDQLWIVPLPPAGFASLGLLGGIAGVRTLRRR
ncbi:MAG: Cys-Gln thioester bond-forming surface protein [Phycisphaerales bacterium JB052]